MCTNWQIALVLKPALKPAYVVVEMVNVLSPKAVVEVPGSARSSACVSVQARRVVSMSPTASCRVLAGCAKRNASPPTSVRVRGYADLMDGIASRWRVHARRVQAVFRWDYAVVTSMGASQQSPAATIRKIAKCRVAVCSRMVGVLRAARVVRSPNFVERRDDANSIAL